MVTVFCNGFVIGYSLLPLHKRNQNKVCLWSERCPKARPKKESEISKLKYILYILYIYNISILIFSGKSKAFFISKQENIVFFF